MAPLKQRLAQRANIGVYRDPNSPLERYYHLKFEMGSPKCLAEEFGRTGKKLADVSLRAGDVQNYEFVEPNQAPIALRKFYAQPPWAHTHEPVLTRIVREIEPFLPKKYKRAKTAPPYMPPDVDEEFEAFLKQVSPCRKRKRKSNATLVKVAGRHRCDRWNSFPR